MIRSVLFVRFAIAMTAIVIAFWLRDDLSAQQKSLPVDKDHAEKMARGLDVFKKSVRPVLVQQCLKCHGGETTEGELDLTDRDRLLNGGNNGPAFISGDAKRSLVFKMVNHEKKP